MHEEVKQVIGFVIEGACPLCKVGFYLHDDRACCLCCGDSYRVATDRLDVKQCPIHGRNCEHWQAMWATMLP